MPNTVTINSKVKVIIDGRFQELQVVGSADVNPKAGKISYLSPIGEAILSKEAGSNFIIELPSGKTIEGRVVRIF